MTHVPYGYKIEAGVAVQDEKSAEAIKKLFDIFIECKSMRAAAKASGIEKTHSVIGRIIKNEVYLGTDFYPQLIDEETFNKAQEVRSSNARSQNRIRAYAPEKPLPTEFQFAREMLLHDDVLEIGYQKKKTSLSSKSQRIVV